MRIFILVLAFVLGLEVPQSKVILIAHRGDHSSAPENTIKAFEDAIAHGADYIEVDLRTSSDGKLVVMHDATLDRMTNGTGSVRDYSWKSLSVLKVTDTKKPVLWLIQYSNFRRGLSSRQTRRKHLPGL